jgi:hypothetical protein
MFVESEAWDRAALRFEDLAEQFSQLAQTSVDGNAPAFANVAAAAARQWGVTCRRMSGRKSRFVRTKFDDYMRQLHGTIDAICGPFATSMENAT